MANVELRILNSLGERGGLECCRRLERGRGMEASVFYMFYVVKDYRRPPLRMYIMEYTVQNDGIGVEKDVCVPVPFHGNAFNTTLPEC